ncbi:natural killer cell receptor 2B4-like [Athene cunicularia]|uniref:natural killer cell receptor 2B4-like n=1 Tax=Athene cunicularia TaxID=194338 RepID=UPI000EF67AFB|nr:natural killer cell receptor 2B4-like [Athene cunicularia]
MGSQAELHPGEQEGLCWGLRAWGTGGLQQLCPLPGHGASPGATGLRSPLSALGSPQCREQAVSAGETLRLLPEKPPQGWEKVDWRVRLNSGHKIRILTAEKNQAVQFSKSTFSGRAGFQLDTLSLWISAVGTADSRVYEVEFEDTSGTVTAQWCFHVSVWEPVRSPHLEQNLLHREQGWCNLSLVCAVPGASNVSYSWTCSGDPLGDPEPRPWVHLQVRDGDNLTVCSCNASNPVSWSVASTDVTAACHTEASGLSNIIPWLAVAVFLGLALSVALAVICYLKRKRGKASPGGHVEEMMTVYEEVGKARPRQDPNGTSEATAGGNTIYAVVSNKMQGPSHPQEPESLTIYSTVQPTRRAPSLKKKRLDPALVSTAYVEVTSIAPAMGGSRRWCSPVQTSPAAPASPHLS